MNAIVEIDKSGRLVIPKKMRDKLGVKAGDRLSVEQTGSTIVIQLGRRPLGLYKERGYWVFDSGVPMKEDDVSKWIDLDRDDRMRFVSGLSTEP